MLPTGLVVAMLVTSVLGLIFSYRVMQVSNTSSSSVLAASPSPGGGGGATKSPTKPAATKAPTPQPSGGGGPKPTAKPTSSSGGGGSTKTPTPKPTSGNSQCFGAMAINPAQVSSNGSFTCTFNYGTTLSGNHLNCAILDAQGVLVTGNNSAPTPSPIGCTLTSIDKTNKTVTFGCNAPAPTGTYSIEAYLFPTSLQATPPPIESMPSGCQPITASLCVGSNCVAATPTSGAGGGATTTPGGSTTGTPAPTSSASCSGLFPRLNY